MIPKILEYEDGIIKVTPQAYGIPECRAIIDKYTNYEVYLLYVYNMSAPDSPYINQPRDEKVEAILYDLQSTFGNFDFEDPLLDVCIEKFKSMYASEIYLLAEELGQELSRFRKALRDTPLVLGGEDSNFRDRLALLEKIEKVSASYQKVKKQADDELTASTKGDHEIGLY